MSFTLSGTVKSGQTRAIKVPINHMGVHVCVPMYVLDVLCNNCCGNRGESLQLLCCIIDKKLNLLIFVAP